MDYFDVLFAKTNGISSGSCYNEIEAMLEATVGHSSKNLFEITAETDTNRGVTFTVDKQAGTVTTSGTATGGSAIFVMNIPSGLSGNYYLSGCAEGGSSSTYYIEGRDLTTNSKLPSWEGASSVNCYDPYQSRQIAIPQGHECALRIVFARNTNADGLVFRPMIRDARIENDGLDPYITPTDKKKQDKIKTLYVAPSLESASDEVIIPRTNDINLFVAICLAIGDTNTAVTFIVPQELFGYPCVNGDFSITGSVVDSSHNKLIFGFPNTFTAGKIIRVLGIPNISYEAEEVN